jgi:ATP-dependent RNA helicase DeaD
MPLDRIPPLSEITQLFHSAGHKALTPVQEKLVPHILRGRDVAAQVEPGSGKTAAYLAAYMAGFRGAAQGLRVLVLLPDVDKVRRLAREHQRFSRVLRDPPPLMCVGDTDDARREQRRLETAPVIVAGTVERVIDHIRRGSLSFDALSAVVIDQPEGELAGDFVRDVQFIFAKLPARRQVLLFSRGPVAVAPAPAAPNPDAPPPVEGIIALLHHPVLLSGGADGEGGDTAGAYVEVGAADKADLLWRILLTRRAAPVLVLHGARTEGEKLARRLVSFRGRTASLTAGLAPAARRRAISAYEERGIDVLFAPLPVPADVDPSRAALVVYYDVPLQQRPSAPAAGPASARRPDPLRSGRRFVILVDAHQERDFQKLQETLPMALNSESQPADADVIRGSLERIVRAVKEEADPVELGRIRSLFRGTVPLFLRSYVAAYLLKSNLPGLGAPAAGPEGPKPRQADRGRPRAEQGRSERLPAAGRGPAQEQRPAGRRPPEAQRQKAPRSPDKPVRDAQFARRQQAGETHGDFTQLFVSVGRNRRVYPRDLSDLFTQTLQLRPEEIGAVRVFDKYSFVEIAPARAADAISQLSGKDFKGRPVTVNFAKKREEKEGQ